jgi:hypothetical protein
MVRFAWGQNIGGGAAFDAKWGGGPIDPDFFTRLVYEGI